MCLGPILAGTDHPGLVFLLLGAGALIVLTGQRGLLAAKPANVGTIAAGALYALALIAIAAGLIVGL